MFRARSLRLVAGSCAAACVAILALAPGGAAAAGEEPRIDGAWVSRVTATSVDLRAEINPGGLSTSYYFEYLPQSQYLANGESFSGAATVPSSGSAFLGYGSEDLIASQHLSSLPSGASYAYRVTATNSAGTAVGVAHVFTTQGPSPSVLLADGRAWEMVSPVDKNGGSIQAAGANAGGDVLQAAAQGGAVTYSSASSFGEGPAGAPPASQYVSRRAANGWSTENITLPAISGSYGSEPRGVPYQLFSSDLARGLVLNGQPCRGEGETCPVANPPLPGSGAPAGYQDYYLRDDESGAVAALLTQPDIAGLALGPALFRLQLAGASPDLRHVVLSSCAKLTEGASEVPGTGGCDPAATNLYSWAPGQPLSLINSSPGAALAAQRAAISTDGALIYFTEGGSLKVWDRGSVEELAEGAEFQAATPDGSVAFYTKEGQLYRYSVASRTSSDLTPGGEVLGVLGISDDGSHVYYEDEGGIELWNGTTTNAVPVAGAAQESDFVPGSLGGAGKGTARVSADGSRLAFLSVESEALNRYDNTESSSPAACGLPSGICDSEVYLYEAGSGQLSCVSCNPTGSRPLGPSTIPGAIANGTVAGSTEAYEPRALSADGRRLFFDSGDGLVPSDTNRRPDVYQWEAQGEGTCQSAGGCLSLISSGRGEDGASFVDASANGDDAFFLTGQSLIKADPGSTDVYDARVGGGVPEPPGEELCVSDECAPLPIAPEEPTIGTAIPGPSNAPLVAGHRCPKSKHRVVRHGKITCAANSKGHHSNKKHQGHHAHHKRHRARTTRLRRAGE